MHTKCKEAILPPMAQPGDRGVDADLAARFLDACPSAFVAVFNGRVGGWNRAAEELFGWAAEEVLDSALPDVLAPLSPSSDATGPRLLLSDRAGRTLEVAAGPATLLHDDAGAVVGWGRLVAPCGSARQDLDEGLAVLRAELAALHRQGEGLADHVAGLTHDLRSPLGGMLAFVQTMRRSEATASSAERMEYLDIMERQVRRLMGLVEDLLLAARLDAGALTIDETEPVELAELVAQLATAIAPARRERLSVETRPPVLALVDRRQIERVVQNLLDNAFLHTPSTTRVKVSAHSDSGEAVMAVHDDGPGIPPEVRDRLFTRYGRGPSSPSGSTGLGLYTAKGIVAAHGGRLSVSSDPGRGTTFEVRLPAAEPATRA